MSQVVVRFYLSPTLVLLAFDWPDANQNKDFLGFAIRRSPGFYGEASSWLPNRISFNGPDPDGKDFPSNEAPIQKFMWWDARIGSEYGNYRQFTYEIYPAIGGPGAVHLQNDDMTTLNVKLPEHKVDGIGTWFNRAVVSSQSFSKKLKEMKLRGNSKPSKDQVLKLREWLSNDMHLGLVDFIRFNASMKYDIYGAIYHLTDSLWTVPELKNYNKKGKVVLVYDAKHKMNKDGSYSVPPTETIKPSLPNVIFKKRDKTSIMHNKFLIGGTKLNNPSKAKCEYLLMGSANFTTQGLTSQANLIHTFDSIELSRNYYERYLLLANNPTTGKTAKEARWSYTETIGRSAIRVFFSPEPKEERESIDVIVNSIHSAQSSVLFCLFMPTDALLRQACFAAGDKGRMMFGLVNNVSDKEGVLIDDDMPADEIAAIELYHRSRTNSDVIPAEYYRWDNKPDNFYGEYQLFPGEKRPPYPPVIIHHKFVVIDAETENPTIYVGSANMSNNSLHNNDENLLEIKGNKELASVYLAEFLRLYEHYRARASWIKNKNTSPSTTTYKLQSSRDAWAKKHLTPGMPEYKARIAMTTIV